MNVTLFAENFEPVAAEWGEAPLLTPDMLSGTFWTLTDINNGELTPFLVMAPDGLIGNFFHPHVDFWQIVNGRLCLVANNGLPSVVFNAAQTMRGEVTALAGPGKIHGRESVFVIARTEHPIDAEHGTPLGVERRAHFLKQPAPGASKRPNLVVVRANSKSLHHRWLEDVTNLTRSWDLCISYYGDDVPDNALVCEYLTHQPNQKKFKPIYDLFHEGSPLWDYDRIWLPDDDLLTTGSDINELFHISSKIAADLCQPSLRVMDGCYINHPITAQIPNSSVRFEPFVEIMAPLFSRRALKICIGSLRDAVSGYGLDHLWPGFLGRPVNRIAIIDRVSIVHTRPIGATYNVRGAIDEQARLFEMYQFTPTKIAGVW